MTSRRVPGAYHLAGGTVIRVGHHRRFTDNHTFHIDLASRHLLLKLSPNAKETAAEVAGHRQIHKHYPVPRLRARVRAGRWAALIYDRATSTLLLDEINWADAMGDFRRLDACLDDVFGRYRTVLEKTLEYYPLRYTVTKLYGQRAHSGGRLDQYYSPNQPLMSIGEASICPTDLASIDLVVNGVEYQIDFARLLTWLRSRLSSNRYEWSAITQGDPTDLNIGWTPIDGPVWFDYDTAGRNALPGEFACFLWYQHLHGGWLVPNYNAAAFVDHPLATAHRCLNEPTVQVDHGSRYLTIEARHVPSPARQHTIIRYIAEIVEPAASNAGMTDLLDWLRPWLVMRVLAVYRLGDLSTTDAALHLAYLARIMDVDTHVTQLLVPQRTGVS